MKLNLLFTGLLALALPSALRAEDSTFSLTIRGHKFEPAALTVPIGTKFRLIVKNEDQTPEEFESYELNREKVVAANSEIVLFIGPLSPGTYPYFGDFHQDSAQGVLTAK